MRSGQNRTSPLKMQKSGMQPACVCSVCVNPQILSQCDFFFALITTSFLLRVGSWDTSSAGCSTWSVFTLIWAKDLLNQSLLSSPQAVWNRRHNYEMCGAFTEYSYTVSFNILFVLQKGKLITIKNASSMMMWTVINCEHTFALHKDENGSFT